MKYHSIFLLLMFEKKQTFTKMEKSKEKKTRVKQDFFFFFFSHTFCSLCNNFPMSGTIAYLFVYVCIMNFKVSWRPILFCLIKNFT